MKKLCIIYILTLFELTNCYTINMHNQSKTDPVTFYISSTLTGCGFKRDVPANGTVEYKAGGFCIGACYDAIEVWSGKPTKKVAAETNMGTGLGICSGMEIFVAQKADSKWTLSHSNIGYSHTIKNNSTYTISIYVDQASCSNDCWYAIEPGQTFQFNTGLCCIQSVTWWANDDQGNFKGGSSGRFDLVCHSTSWSLDASGKIDGQDVCELKRLS